MILIKNTASQIVYSRLIDTSTSLPVPDVSSGDITTYIIKDGGTEATAANSVSHVGHGIYKLTLSQAETNCSTGVINMTDNAVSTNIFETIFFETTESNPSVNVLQNNDKTGYFLDNDQTFNTSGTIGSISDPSSIISMAKFTTYDGITQEKIYDMLIAFMAGKVVITTDSPTTKTISYKKRDGSTEVFQVIVSTEDGSRAAGGTISS